MRVKATFPTLSERNQALKAPAITRLLQLKNDGRLQQTGKLRPASIPPVRTVHPVATHRLATAQIHKTHAGAKLFHQRLLIKRALLSARFASDGDHRSLEISKCQRAEHISIFSFTIFFVTFRIELNLLDESIEQQPSRDAGRSPPDSCSLTRRHLKNKNRT